jgi:predicted PurR-regulated permease PerM
MSPRARVTATPSGAPVTASTTGETLLLAAGVLLLALLCYAIAPALSPFVVVLAIVFLLTPLRGNPVARRFMLLGVGLFAVWFFSSISGLLTPFLIAFLIAYVLNPSVTWLETRRVPRWLSSLVVVLFLLGAVVAVGIFFVPLALEQLQSVNSRAAALADDLSRFIGSGKLFDVLARFGVDPSKAREVVMQNLGPRVEELLKNLFEALFGVVAGVSSVAHQLLNIIIIPFVAFYLLMDFPVVTHRFAMLVPKRSRGRFVELASRADAIMGRYFRGAIILATLQGIISGCVLAMIGVDYAVPLGLMTAVLDFIPYVGLAISLVVACIVALFSGGAVLTKVTLVVIMYLTQKLLEGTVLAPKILGSHIGLHPVLLILCLLVFGYFLGFVGLLIAVPATALIIAGVKEWETARKQKVPPKAGPAARA